MSAHENRLDHSCRILKIRGKAVILDADLAVLYQVQIKRLNEQVRRNRNRFPPDFLFILTPDEQNSLRSQIATLKSGRGSHRKYPPMAFTEQGVAMLSGILRSVRAVSVHIAIMRAFIKMRRALAAQRELAFQIERIEGRLDLHDTDIRLLHGRVQQIEHSSTHRPEKSTKVDGFALPSPDTGKPGEDE